MNPSQRDKLLLELFASATESSEPQGPHVADDSELLTSWSLGTLAGAERQQMMEHLASCSRCRSELLRLIDGGVVGPPGVVEDDAMELALETIGPGPEQIEAKVIAHRPWWRSSAAALALVSVAAVVTAMVLWNPTSSSTTADTVLAGAARRLSTGNARAAYGDVEELLSKPGVRLSVEQKEQATKLLIAAAGQVAASELHEKHFEEARDVATRASELAGRSARLENLRLQADHEAVADVSLKNSGSLTNFGYALDGNRRPDWHDPVPSEAAQKRAEAFRSAVAEFPDDVDLRLNYGNVLLESGNHAPAREQFNEALRADQTNRLARIGLGLADFEEGRFDEARQQFAEATHTEPGDLDSNINLAMTLERLGKRGEAGGVWEHALSLTRNESLQQQIKQQMQTEPATQP